MSGNVLLAYLQALPLIVSLLSEEIRYETEEEVRLETVVENQNQASGSNRHQIAQSMV